MITYHNGDLLKSGCDIIAHQVNLQGIMGGGLAKQIATKYPKCEENYIRYIKHFQKGGEVQLFPLNYPTNNKFIANCFSQEINFNTNYDWLLECFSTLKRFALYNLEWEHPRPTIGIPFNYGCGIAHGNWDKVFAVFEELFGNDPNIELQIWHYMEE